MNKYFYTITLSTVILLGMGLSACNPELIAARNLEGDWDVKSYTVDGEEAIGFILNSFQMEFEEYDGDEGDFNFFFIDEAGQSSTLTGEYELNADGDEIDLTYSSGSVEMWDMTLDGDDLELEGNFDGTRFVINAERD